VADITETNDIPNERDALSRSGGALKGSIVGILFEGVILPLMMRPKKAEEIFQIGHGTLYVHLNTGHIRSVAVKGRPTQRRATRLIYTQSLIDFIRSCEK
jgi:hypothetical protein